MDPQNYEDPQDFNPSRWDVSGLLVCKKKKKNFFSVDIILFLFLFFYIPLAYIYSYIYIFLEIIKSFSLL